MKISSSIWTLCKNSWEGVGELPHTERLNRRIRWIGTAFGSFRQPAQPIHGAIQGFGQSDQGGNGGPCFAMFDRVQALGAYSYVGRQLARGPSLLLTPGTNSIAQNFFREIHVSPLDRQLLTYVFYRYQL